MATVMETYFTTKVDYIGSTWVKISYELSGVTDESCDTSISVYIGSSNSGTLLKTVSRHDKFITGLEPNTTYYIESTAYSTYDVGASFTTKYKDTTLVSSDNLQQALALYANSLATKKYLHRITLNTIDNDHYTTLKVQLDYYSTVSTPYTNIMFNINSASDPYYCHGLFNDASPGGDGKIQVYCFYFVDGDTPGYVVNNTYSGSMVLDECTITDEIIGYIFS